MASPFHYRVVDDDGVEIASVLQTLASWKNDPIPASEAFTARAALFAAEQELQALESRRNTVLSRMDVYNVALASHKNLPVDIMNGIFTLCVSAPAELNYILTYATRKDIRLILCQICSRWRAIALDNHRLWNEVKIDFGRPSISRVLDILPVWLSRAKGSTFFLELTARENDPRLTEILARYSHQCHTIVFTGFQVMDSLFWLAASSFNRVANLQLNNDGNRHPAGMTPAGAPAVFDDMPLLRSVTLTSFSYLFPAELMRLPWHQLTSLDATPLPNAVSTAEIESADYEISLPALRLLELNTDFITNAARFLSGLALNFLVELSLGLSYGDGDQESLLGVRPFPALRRFSLLGRGITSQSDLKIWLQACPAVVEVCLPHHFLEPRLIGLIADGQLLPRLELLTLMHAVPDVLLGALETRQRSLEYSTIVEIGITGTSPAATAGWVPEYSRILNLQGLGVFMANCYNFLEPLRGQIEQVARLNVEEDYAPLVRRKNLPFYW
ncbi:hypothetical protein B0H19DRAFT_1377001 [Mycena capillaripes]|nr:hypothetical protein B0H19DRAFT_1377001 [Mycena capillaripes]